jgi:hypothetical protein
MPIRSIAEATDEEWDACQRLADAVNIHVLAQNAELGNGRDRPGYVAVRLADGRSDGVLYDTRADAVRHQAHAADPYFAYIKVGRQMMPPREAWVVLMYHRQAAASGHVLAEEEVILPHRLELVRDRIPRTVAGAVPHMFRGPRG